MRTGDRMLRWVYESKNVTLVPDVAVRLPDTADLLPNELARRALSGARSGEVSRLPARRIAGRDALGLRLRPADPQASIGRVDVYADRATGLPVQVQMFGRGAATPSVTSRFLDLTAGGAVVLGARVLPAARRAPAQRRRRRPRRRRQPVRLPGAAAGRWPGCPQRAAPAGRAHGAVGVYGRGPTVLLAVPLWQPERRPGARGPAQGARHAQAGRRAAGRGPAAAAAAGQPRAQRQRLAAGRHGHPQGARGRCRRSSRRTGRG